MIRKFKSFETNFSVAKATFIVGFFALASRAVGLVRDRLFASRFGAGDTLDVYYASFGIPDFIFNLLILGTLSVAFIPVFTELLITDKERAYKNANSILNLSFIIMSVVCLGLIIFAKPLTHLLVPGFSGQKFLDTVSLSRILLISPVIFTLSNIFTSILNSQKKFIIANLAPVMYNLGIIAGLLFFYPRFGLMGLGYGVILGALLHLLVQIPEAVRFGYTWRPVLDLKDTALQKTTKLFLPRILGVDNSQISLLIGKVVGSVLVSGSISIFNLANNLQAVPLGVFAIATAVAVFPLLSEQYAKKDDAAFVDSLKSAMGQVLFFMIPFSIIILLLRAHLVRLAFGAGNFNWEDTILTFQTLGIFSVSLFAQGLTPLLARAFYARQNTKTPVIVGLATMFINASLAYVLGKHYGAAGMAAAFSVASIFNAIILFAILRLQFSHSPRVNIHNFDKELFQTCSKIVLASLLSGLVAYLCLYIVEPVVNTHTVLGLLLQAGLAGAAACAVFLFTAKLMELEQANKVIAWLKLKFSV